MKALAAFETNSVAQGYLLADEALKTAEVTLIEATAVCAGKHITLLSGTPAAVRGALESARLCAASGLLFRELYLAQVHAGVLQALCGQPLDVSGALGVFETFSAIDAIELADGAAKSCPVDLLEIRLGRGLGGKSTVSFCGPLAGVEAALAKMLETTQAEGTFSDGVVLANPSLQARRGAVSHGPGMDATSERDDKI